MKMFELKCPYCGADLEVKDNIDTFYCMHCGGKIVLEGMDDNTVKLRMQAKEIDYEKYKLDRELEEREKERAHEKKIKLINVVISPAFWAFVIALIALIKLIMPIR